MKVLFVFLAIGLTSTVIGQNRYHIDKTTFDIADSNDLVYLKYDMKPLNGILYCDFGDIGKYVNGYPDGSHKNWFSNGKMKYEGDFDLGFQEGNWMYYYSNGQVKVVGNYIHGDRSNLDETGIPINGRYGAWKYYYEDGRIKYEESYKDGKPNGLFRFWYKDGQIKYEFNFKDGKPNGLCRFWYENGQLEGERYYIDGERDSLWRGWYENGRIEYEESYKNDKLEGLFRGWYENGQIKYEERFKDGRLLMQEYLDVQASFVGGELELTKWLQENLKYPESSILWGDQGKVYLHFVIEKNGKITNIQVIKKVSTALDEEAIRLVKNMPSWIPAESKGLKVQSTYVLPINFELN